MFAQESGMDLQKEREAFEKECRLLCYKGNMVMSNLGSFYNNEQTNWMWQMWLSAKAQAVPECTWVKNEDGYFDASCGQSFVFSEPEDKPSSHEFTHCCFCGGKLIEAQEPTND